MAGILNWQGQPWAQDSGEKAAHPNSRFTAPASQCPSISPEWQNPPITAILFGARRQRVVPLVYQAMNWQHDTFFGATLSSETTAAAVGRVGVLRRDPMAMQPFVGYNMADYWAHWLDVGAKLENPPAVFRVNWFRTGDNGKFMWPGFGENLRVLKWVLDRCEGRGEAVQTPIGYVPTRDAIDRAGPIRRWKRSSGWIVPSGWRPYNHSTSSSRSSATASPKASGRSTKPSPNASPDAEEPRLRPNPAAACKGLS